MLEVLSTAPPLPYVWKERDDGNAREQIWFDAWSRVKQTEQLLSLAAKRIRARYPRADAVLQDLYGRASYFKSSPLIWITDQPAEIYKGRKIVYHVGSSRSLDALCEGKTLLPPAAHFEHLIRTHKGLGLATVSLLLEAAGEDATGKDSALWAGSIDPEQIAIEQRISQTGEAVDDQMSDLFFVPKVPYEVEIRPEFRQVLEMLSKCQRPGDIPELKKWIEQTMQGFFKLHGLRFIWYKSLKDFLQGDKSGVDYHFTDGIEEIMYGVFNLYTNFFQWEQAVEFERPWESLPHARIMSLSPSQAVVMEINLPALFSRVLKDTPYPTISGFSPRDPDESISLPNLVLSDVTRVFAWKPDEVSVNTREALAQAGIPLEPLESIPPEALLDPNSPVRLDPDELSPESSLCSRRYVDRPVRQQKWREQLQRGLMVPLESIRWFERLYRQDRQVLSIFSDELLTGEDYDDKWREIRSAFLQELKSRIFPGSSERMSSAL